MDKEDFLCFFVEIDNPNISIWDTKIELGWSVTQFRFGYNDYRPTPLLKLMYLEKEDLL